MTLTKAELADLLFEQVGLNKREAKDMVEPSSRRSAARSSAAKASSSPASATSSCATSRSARAAIPKTGEEIPITRPPRRDVPRQPEAEGHGREGAPCRSQAAAKADLPPIPAKRYFTIGEVSELCGVKPHVLRYWEQEFTQLKPVKRRGNRRYYQHHEVLLIRRIRELLYEQGFTISGARNRLDNARLAGAQRPEAGCARRPPGTAPCAAASTSARSSGSCARFSTSCRGIIPLFGA